MDDIFCFLAIFSSSFLFFFCSQCGALVPDRQHCVTSLFCFVSFFLSVLAAVLNKQTNKHRERERHKKKRRKSRVLTYFDLARFTAFCLMATGFRFYQFERRRRRGAFAEERELFDDLFFFLIFKFF